LGGVLVPALIYFLFNKGTATAGGWGIPMATDIAFALAVITLLGKRAPLSLKVFLTALAIVDDLMAILVIAVFYSSGLAPAYLGYAAGLFVLLLLLNRLGVKNIFCYLVPGIFMWYFIHHSGVHATIAGVLTALTVPVAASAGRSPLESLEHALAAPVNFIIMPLFALANTNIRFTAEMPEGLFTPLGCGIVLGLFVGKPAGIAFFSWLSVKLGLCAKPAGSNWWQILGAGMLGGIGFTMSIFISVISFTGQEMLLSEAKFAILTGSVLSGICGYFFLSRLGSRVNKTTAA
jgi:NhaA family Na+:H+ antiporter